MGDLKLSGFFLTGNFLFLTIPCGKWIALPPQENQSSFPGILYQFHQPLGPEIAAFGLFIVWDLNPSVRGPLHK